MRSPHRSSGSRSGGLETRLQHAEARASSLEEQLSRRNREMRDLDGELSFQKRRTEDLELQLLEKSAKLSEMTQILECRGDANETEEQLLKKSMEHAEATLSIDRLRLELQKADKQVKKLRVENRALKEFNEGLSNKLEEATSNLHDRQNEKSMNEQMLVDLEEIVQFLQESGSFSEIPRRTRHDSEDDSRSRDSCSVALDTIRQSIQDMAVDRKRLRNECESLREENRHQNRKLKALKDRQVDGMSGRSASPTMLTTQSTPFSVETKLLEAAENNQDRVEVTRNQESTFPISPTKAVRIEETVPLKKYDRLQKQYNDANDEIVRMSAEIGKAKAVEQEREDAVRKIEDLENNLSRVRIERNDAFQEVASLERELKKAEKALKAAASETSELQESYERRLSETTEQAQSLQVKCQRLESDFAAQIGELELQVEDSEKFFRLQCDGLKQQHLTKMEEVTRENEALKEKNEASEASHKQRFDQLNLEFDTFMEMHTRLEDDMVEVKSKYDEALNKIVSMEHKQDCARKIRETEQKKHNDIVAKHLKTIAELEESVDKSKLAMQEAVLKHQKLRRDYEEILHQLEVAKVETNRERQVVEDLKNNCCDMEERLKQSDQTGAITARKLGDTYKLALQKLDSLASKLHSVGMLDEDSGMAMTSKNKHSIAYEKMKVMEQELLGTSDAASSKASHDESQFQVDWSSIVRQVIGKGQRSGIEQASWYWRIAHQKKLGPIHSALFHSVAGLADVDCGTEACDQKKADTPTSANHIHSANDFLGHRKKLNGVHLELSNRSGHSVTQTNSDTSSTMVSIFFLRHQRYLNAVHFDLLSHVHTTGIAASSETITNDSIRLQSYANGSDIGASFRGRGLQSIDEARKELQQLKGEARRIKLAANTSRIRFEAREKEHRVILHQYKSLLDEFNQLNVPTTEQAPRESTEGSPINGAELKRLRNDLRAAELKVEMMALELRSSNKKANEAQRHFEEGEKKVQSVLERCEELEAEQGSPDRKETGQEPEDGIWQTSRDERMQIFRPDPIEKSPEDVDIPRDQSFDGSHLTSFSEGFSAEGRDEKGDREIVQVENTSGDGPLLFPRGPSVSPVVDRLKAELMEAEKLAEQAMTKLHERENDLRQVIAQFKELKVEYDALVLKMNEHGIPLMSEKEPQDLLIRERDIARAEVSMMEKQLEEAKAATKSAKKKQRMREEHLRQVIGLYKALDKEHKITTEELRKTRLGVPIVATPVSPHIIHKVSSQKHNNRFQETMSNKQVDRKRKPWYRDLVSRGARTHNIPSQREQAKLASI